MWHARTHARKITFVFSFPSRSFSPYFPLLTFALLSLALCLQWYNGSYSTVDGRRLIAVANTLRALVLGGVH